VQLLICSRDYRDDNMRHWSGLAHLLHLRCEDADPNLSCVQALCLQRSINVLGVAPTSRSVSMLHVTMTMLTQHVLDPAQVVALHLACGTLPAARLSAYRQQT
jgi:hypothetical protein